MILVTGATGGVGSNVVRELRDRGAAVRALTRDPARARAKLGGDLEIVAGDFADPSSLKRALEGVDTLFLASPSDPRIAEYEANVVDAAVAAGVARLVKLGAQGAAIGDRVRFLDWQGRAEDYVDRSGVPAVIVKPTFYMSNLLAAADQVRGQGMLFAPAEGAKIAMIDPRDVAAVAAVVLTEEGHEGRKYELTGPEVITYHDVAEALTAAVGRPVTFVAVPDEAAHGALLDAGMPEWLAGGVIELFAAIRDGSMEEANDTVRVLTGRSPRTFADFARHHAAAFTA